MKRLTVNFDGQWVPRELCSFDRDGNPDICGRCPGSDGNCGGECRDCPVQACLDRLAAYEDTGLGPGRVREIGLLLAEKCREAAGLKMRIAVLEGTAGAGEAGDGTA